VDTSHEEIVEINHSFSYHLLIDRRMDYESSATSVLPRLSGTPEEKQRIQDALSGLSVLRREVVARQSKPAV